jgi:hypothetical protein
MGITDNKENVNTHTHTHTHTHTQSFKPECQFYLLPLTPSLLYVFYENRAMRAGGLAQAIKASG